MIINLRFASSIVAVIVAVLIPASCADPPKAALGPRATPEPGTATATPAVAALDTEPPADLPLIVLVAPDREVMVDLSEGKSARARLHAELDVLNNSKARGQLRLKLVESYEGGGTGPLIIVVAFTDATLIQADEDWVLEFKGKAAPMPPNPSFDARLTAI